MKTLPFNDYDFYLCGPAAFMQSIYDGLRALNIADARIHAEAFGPSALDAHDRRGHGVQPMRARRDRAGAGRVREVGEGGALDARRRHAARPCRSARPRRPSSVAGAAAAGRAGRASSRARWRTRVAPSFHVADDEALICCAVPAQADAGKPAGSCWISELPDWEAVVPLFLDGLCPRMHGHPRSMHRESRWTVSRRWRPSSRLSRPAASRRPRASSTSRRRS